MDTLHRKKFSKYRSTLVKHRRRDHWKTNHTNKYQFDWLLCLIFCLGFIVATLIAIVIYALIQHQQNQRNGGLLGNNNYNNRNDEEFGLSIIDYSREIDKSEIDKSDLPDPLPSLQSDEIENNSIYKSLRDEIDIMKLPNNCSLIDQVYECQGIYFQNFTHYNDDWSDIAGTTWYIPEKIATTFVGKKKQFKKWRYDIINYPIIPNYLRSNKSRDNIGISIVTQTSMDRLNLLEMIASNWNGVICVAIYIRLEESLLHSQQLIIELFERVETKYNALLDISLLFETDYLYKRNKEKGLYSVMYPVNHLRNLALQTAKTELVLLTDGDFMPNKDFHDKAIKQYELAVNKWNNNNNNNNNNKYKNDTRNIALIIPAFEFGTSYKFYTKKQKKKKRRAIRKQEEESQKMIDNISELPLTKEKIIELYNNDKVRGFHIHRCTACHTPTNYSKWLNATEPYIVRYKASYEPYIMTKRIGLHRYDARFRGYGWNKIVHLLTLAWIDKSHWIVGNDLFIFHIPHYSSRDANNYFKGKNSLRWNWIMGLSKLSLRDLKRRKDQTGYMTT